MAYFLQYFFNWVLQIQAFIYHISSFTCFVSPHTHKNLCSPAVFGNKDFCVDTVRNVHCWNQGLIFLSFFLIFNICSIFTTDFVSWGKVTPPIRAQVCIAKERPNYSRVGLAQLLYELVLLLHFASFSRESRKIGREINWYNLTSKAVVGLLFS